MGGTPEIPQEALMSHEREGTVDRSPAFRALMGDYATGATIVTAGCDAGPHGLAVNSFTSVSMSPQLISFCPDKASETWPAVRDAAFFAVNILAHGQHDVCRQFARKGVDRFEGVGYHRSPNGCPILAGSLGYLECELVDVVDAGDHHIAIGHVIDIHHDADQHPLIYYQGGFHRLEPYESESGLRAS